MAGDPADTGTWRWRRAVWGGAGIMLLLPLLAMQVADEAAWDAADFLVFGAMLAAACGAFELAVRATRNRASRAAAAVALATAFLLVWMNLAVGIIGSEDNPANIMYFGVLAVGILGTLIARFRPRGMAGALVAVALAQVAVAAMALIAGWGNTMPLTSVFVALWLTAAQLFRRAARADPPASSLS